MAPAASTGPAVAQSLGLLLPLQNTSPSGVKYPQDQAISCLSTPLALFVVALLVIFASALFVLASEEEHLKGNEPRH